MTENQLGGATVFIENASAASKERFLEELSEVLPVSGIVPVANRAVPIDPESVKIVLKLVEGGLVAAPFLWAAKTYLKSYLEKSGELDAVASSRFRAETAKAVLGRSGGALRRLVDFFQRRTGSRDPKKGSYAIGIEVLSPSRDVALMLSVHEEGRLAWTLALFWVHAERIRECARQLQKDNAGKVNVWPMELALSEDGSFKIYWGEEKVEVPVSRPEEWNETILK